MYEVAHYIKGQAVAGEPEQASLAIYNPAEGRQIGSLKIASQALVERAVSCASEAFGSWSQVSPLNRARVLFRFKSIIEANLDQLAQTITREHGKTIEDAKGEIIRGIEVVEFACGIPHVLKGDYTEQVGTGVDAYSLNQPLGVVAGISPFNFPAMVPMWMWPIAIACGNTFVLKPSEKDPSASLLIADWLDQAGLPPGVFNVLQGDKTTVTSLIEHKTVQALSFVGSTPVAESIYIAASSAGKRVQALGGAKNHMIVMPDADLSAAANGLIGAAFGSAGERCMAISVAVAVGEAADPLVALIQERAKQLQLGDGNQAGSDIGPLISAAHLEKVLSYIDLGLEQGAQLLLDGREHKNNGLDSGYFLGPSIFDHVEPQMQIYQEEIFGPVLCVVRVADFEQALALINQHRFANGTSIYTQNGYFAQQFAARVQVGMVGINIPIPVPMAFHAFGGWKESLFGAHHMYGNEGVKFYTRRKAVTARWPKGDVQAEFVMPTLK